MHGHASLQVRPQLIPGIHVLFINDYYNSIIYIDVLERWEVPPINEVSRKLERMERSIRKQEESIDELRFDYNNNIMHRTA